MAEEPEEAKRPPDPEVKKRTERRQLRIFLTGSALSVGTAAAVTMLLGPSRLDLGQIFGIVSMALSGIAISGTYVTLTHVRGHLDMMRVFTLRAEDVSEPRKKQLKRVRRLVKSSDGGDRLAGVFAFGKMHAILSDKEAAEGIAAALAAAADPSEAVREQAAVSLGQLRRRTTGDNREAVMSAFKALSRDRSPAVRAQTAIRLGMWGDVANEKEARVAAGLLADLIADDPEGEVRVRAAMALDRLEHTFGRAERHPDFYPTYEKMEWSNDYPRGKEAMARFQALRKLDEAPLYKPFKDEKSYDAEMWVARIAFRAPGHEDEESRGELTAPGRRARLMDGALKRSMSADPADRVSEVFVLLTFVRKADGGRESPEADRLVALVRDPDPSVSQAAVKALSSPIIAGQILSDRARRATLEALVAVAAPGGAAARGAALGAIGGFAGALRIDDLPIIGSAAVDAAGDPDGSLRKQAAEVLMNDWQVVPKPLQAQIVAAVIRLCGDPNPEVRLRAFRALPAVEKIMEPGARGEIALAVIAAVSDPNDSVGAGAGQVVRMMADAIPPERRAEAAARLVEQFRGAKMPRQAFIAYGAAGLVDAVPPTDAKDMVTRVWAMLPEMGDFTEFGLRLLAGLGPFLQHGGEWAVFEAMKTRAAAKDDELREAALRGLGRLSEYFTPAVRTQAVAVLQAAVISGDEATQTASHSALGWAGRFVGPDEAEALAEFWTKRATGSAMASIPRARAVFALALLAENATPARRGQIATVILGALRATDAAAISLGLEGANAAGPFFEPAARKEAAEAALAVGPGHPEAVYNALARLLARVLHWGDADLAARAKARLEELSKTGPGKSRLVAESYLWYFEHRIEKDELPIGSPPRSI